MATGETVHDQEVLDFLIEWTLDRERGHERPLLHYLERFPGREEAVAREFLRLRQPGAPDDGAGADTQVGPYELVAELGRGGQGTVWLARDRRLARDVALKVLHAGHRSAASPQRFRREALVAARLDHPCLATVFDAGEDRGRAWLAMRYVAGESLATLLARHRASAGSGVRCLRLPHVAPQARERDAVLAVAGFVARAARALEFAHGLGVVHRDVKPGNLMVTPHGVPVLVDFGLARDPDSSAACLTQSGEHLGTPAYMAPEQLEPGSAGVTAAVDLWALAVVLWECVTGLHPFPGASRQAVQRAICELEPASARAINAAVPKGLATVLAVALQKDPRRRHASIAAFAADLELVAAGEPPTCRPPGAVERLRRQARRHPAAAVAVLCVVTFVSIAFVYVDGARRREAGLRAEATDRATDLRRLARGLLLEMHAMVRTLPGATEVSRELGTRALEYLQLLRREALDDPLLRADVVTALLQVGDVLGNPRHANLGRHDEATSHYREALALVATGPAFAELRAQCLLRLGELAERDGDVDGALAHWRQAIALLPETPADGPARQLATTLHLRMGETAGWSTAVPERAAQARQALGTALALVGDTPGEPTARLAAATVRTELARGLVLRGDLTAARGEADAASALLQGLPAESSLHLPVRCLRGALDVVLGSVDWKNGRAGDALARLRTAATAFAELAALDPRNEQVARLRLQTLGTLSFVLLDQERHGECEQVLATIDALVAEAAARFGSDWFRLQRADCESRLAQLAYQRRDFDQATALFRRALATQQQRAAAAPGNLQVAGQAALAELRLGWALVRGHRPDDGEQVLASARLALERLVAQDATVLPWRNGLVAAHQQMAEIAFQRGDHAAAAQRYGDAIAAESSLPESPEHVRSLAILRQGLAEARTQSGEPAAACAVAEQAVGELRGLLAATPQDRYVARLLATALANLARHRFAADHVAEVADPANEALRIVDELVGRSDADTATALATGCMAQVMLARCHERSGRYPDARAAAAAARGILRRSPAAAGRLPGHFLAMLEQCERTLGVAEAGR